MLLQNLVFRFTNKFLVAISLTAVAQWPLLGMVTGRMCRSSPQCSHVAALTELLRACGGEESSGMPVW